jgi:hypothetical protein
MKLNDKKPQFYIKETLNGSVVELFKGGLREAKRLANSMQEKLPAGSWVNVYTSYDLNSGMMSGEVYSTCK